MTPGPATTPADPLRLRGQTTLSSLRRKKGEKGREKGRRALTKSLLAKLGHFCLGRATAREGAKSYSLFAAVEALSLLRLMYI